MQGYVDVDGEERINNTAMRAREAFDNGEFTQSSYLFFQTQLRVDNEVDNIDFYNVLTRLRWFDFGKSQADFIEMLQKGGMQEPEKALWLSEIMDLVHEALDLPAEAGWSRPNNVFGSLFEDFMKPVVDVVEKVLNETSVRVIVYSGNLDLICATPGTMTWLNKLNWHGKEGFAAARRRSFGAEGYLEGYSRRFENLKMYWVLRAGHSAGAGKFS